MQNFNAVRLQQYRDRRLLVVQAIRARVRVRYAKLIEPSFCVAQEILITNRHAKFQHFWLRRYQNRTVVLAIWARIRDGYETDRAQLLHTVKQETLAGINFGEKPDFIQLADINFGEISRPAGFYFGEKRTL